MIKHWVMWIGANEEVDGFAGVMALVNGVGFGGELREKGTERCRGQLADGRIFGRNRDRT